MDIFEQIKNSGKSMKKFTNADVVINSNDKGLRMMNFVQDLQVYNNTENNIIYVRACCWASHKRNVKYKLKIVCNQRGNPKILAAKCDRQCPASNSGCCCHVMALIWKLEDMTRKSELKNVTPDNRCCTSKPREWGKGSKREVEFTPVMASKITKPRHASDLPGRKRRSIESQFYDPRPSKSRKLDVDGIVKLRQDLQEINARIPFAVMLPEEKTIPTIMTIVGTVAKGSTIHKQLQDYTRPPTLVAPYFSSTLPAGKGNVNPVFSTTHFTTETTLDAHGQGLNPHSSLNHESSAPLSTVQNESDMSPLSTPPFGQGEPQLWQILDSNANNQQQEQNSSSFIATTTCASEVQLLTTQTKTLFIETLTDKQKQIEMATRGQSTNPTWFKQKQNRITASICKDVFSHMQKQGSKMPENLVKKITRRGAPHKLVNYSQAKNLNYKSKGLIFGIENEPVAADMYKEYLLSLPDIKEVTVQEVGLIVDKENDVLAASPDRIATIVYANGEIEHRNVEIKCLESKQDMSPEAAIKGHQKESSFPVMETNSFFVVKERHK